MRRRSADTRGVLRTLQLGPTPPQQVFELAGRHTSVRIHVISNGYGPITHRCHPLAFVDPAELRGKDSNQARSQRIGGFPNLLSRHALDGPNARRHPGGIPEDDYASQPRGAGVFRELREVVGIG